MCKLGRPEECKVIIQSLQSLISRVQDVAFEVQSMDAPDSGFVFLANIAMQNAMQSLSAAADHLQHAVNGTVFP